MGARTILPWTGAFSMSVLCTVYNFDVSFLQTKGIIGNRGAVLNSIIKSFRIKQELLNYLLHTAESFLRS
jgi:hypothetical protein